MVKTALEQRRPGRLWQFMMLWLLLSLIVAAVLWVLYWVQVRHARSLLLTEERQAVQLAIQSIRAELSNVGGDLDLLSRQSMLQQWLQSPDPRSWQLLTADFAAFLNSRKFYDQIRFIDMWGHEQARVSWNAGEVRVAGKSALQDTSHSHHVNEGLRLENGQVYISPLDLNIERDIDEKLFKPTISFAIPVYDPSGQKRGILMLNYLGSRLIGRIREVTARPPSDLWLVNEHGDRLLGDRADTGWGFIPRGERVSEFKADHPGIWRRIRHGPRHGSFASEQNLVAYATLTPAEMLKDYEGLDSGSSGQWFVVSHATSDVLAARIEKTRYSLLVAFILLSVISAIIAWTIVYFMGKRRQAEAALRASESAWRGLVESAPDAIVVVDDQGGIEIANAQAEALFGYTRDELVKRPIEALIPRRYASQHVELRDAYIRAPRVRPMGEGRVLYGLRKDGSEFPVSISLSPIHIDGEQRVISAIRDITAQRENERHIRELNARLVQQNDELERVNHELEAFSYSVSHDLRAPLRAIDGFSQILSQEYAEAFDAEGRDYLERVRKAAQKMGHLIDDLLDLSRITRTEINPQEVDLERMAGEILNELKQQDPAREVNIVMPDSLCARGDSRLLRVMLNNLLSNAWKFTRNTAEPEIEFGTENKDEEMVFFIRDNGAGFEMAYAERMFAAFQRLHDTSEFPGTGIGLATVQRVINKHGGRIWARGEPGRGATFYFTLGKETQ